MGNKLINNESYKFAGTSGWSVPISQSQTTVFVGQWMEWDSLPPCISIKIRKGEDRRKKKREVLHLFRCYTHTHEHTHTGLVLRLEAGSKGSAPRSPNWGRKGRKGRINRFQKLCEWKHRTALNRNRNQQFKLFWRRYTRVINLCFLGFLQRASLGRTLQVPSAPLHIFVWTCAVNNSLC